MGGSDPPEGDVVWFVGVFGELGVERWRTLDAVAIGLANPARSAGFRRGEATLALSVDGDGVPAMRVTKNGKGLKALPAALRKDGEVEELRSRFQELKRQRSRVRDAHEIRDPSILEWIRAGQGGVIG